MDRAGDRLVQADRLGQVQDAFTGSGGVGKIGDPAMGHRCCRRRGGQPYPADPVLIRVGQNLVVGVGYDGIANALAGGGGRDRGLQARPIVVDQQYAGVVDDVVETHHPDGHRLIEKSGLLPVDHQAAERGDGDGHDEQGADTQLEPDRKDRPGPSLARFAALLGNQFPDVVGKGCRGDVKAGIDGCQYGRFRCHLQFGDDLPEAHGLTGVDQSPMLDRQGVGQLPFGDDATGHQHLTQPAVVHGRPSKKTSDAVNQLFRELLQGRTACRKEVWGSPHRSPHAIAVKRP